MGDQKLGRTRDVAGPGLDDLAGAAWESSQEEEEAPTGGVIAGAVAAEEELLYGEDVLDGGEGPREPVVTHTASACPFETYDSDATQCSD
jgi:hypothetical protein